jgi:glycosyltransferase involved in cell wall biosynthesis
MPEGDAGSRAVADLITGLGELGHDVAVLIESAGDLAGRAAAASPDLAIISRPGLFARLEPQLRPLGVPLVYWGHDLHFVRLGLQARFDAALSPQAARVMRAVEQQCFANADLAVLPTQAEADRARQEFPGARVVATPYFAMPPQPAPRGAPAGERIAFVGGEHHAPNRDGIDWFITELWPGVRKRNPAAELVVVGHWARAQPWPPGVRYPGLVPEQTLDALLGSARIGIAPLRFGAGMKRKTLHYLAHGLPVIGTGFAIEGLDADESGRVPGVVTAESAGEWSNAIEALQDDELWMRLAGAGQSYVRQAFSPQRFRDGLAAIVEAVRPPG